MFQHQQKRFFPLLAATWFALAGATAASFAFLPQTAEARVKSEAESRWGQELVEEYDEKYGVEQQADGTPLKRMQDRLVAFNSDKLNYYDGVHEYWIEPVYLAKRYLPGISGIQKGNCIVLSPDDFSDALKDKHYWFVENSNDATTMAHELAHYINHDSESSKLSQSEKEFRADELAMDLMANVPEYSFGSMARLQSPFVCLIFPFTPRLSRAAPLPLFRSARRSSRPAAARRPHPARYRCRRCCGHSACSISQS